ncbi:hypothetical protein BGX34_003888 [Mortierella sp. NVP85]|nr:hypothetical protein BGX34_003888 [Mortierella sp. NVP85]
MASYIGYRAVRPPSRSYTGFVTLSTGKEETSTQINTFILYYIYVTWAAILAYLFFDAGKIWAVIGTLHNLLEVVLMVAFHHGGRITSVTFALYMFVYVVMVIVLSAYLSWPADAIFFRWQGLCSDFALIFVFSRTYFATKTQLGEHGGCNNHDEELAAATRKMANRAQRPEQQRHVQELREERQRLLQRQEELQQQNPRDTRQREELGRQLDEVDHQLDRLEFQQNRRQFRDSVTLMAATPIQDDLVPNGDDVMLITAGMIDEEKPVWSVIWHNPRQLLLLIAAASFHVLGNCMTTIFAKSTYAQGVFLVSYGLSFPLYAYYLYIDNHALRQTKIYLPSTSKYTFFSLVCWSIFFSTAIVRLGLFVAKSTKDSDAN